MMETLEIQVVLIVLATFSLASALYAALTIDKKRHKELQNELQKIKDEIHAHLGG